MPKKTEVANAGQSFEDLKQMNEHGAEYWSARSLQPLLGYSQWRRFEQTIERAATSCKESGNPSEHHFAGAGKPITGGKGAIQVVDDYHLSRFACYLIAQNSDPRKPESFGSTAPTAGRRAHVVHRAMGIEMKGQEQ